ncbi:MAG: hypothetical protein BMS9Abin36_0079 [Gammaproteobacteria bacterium]|nr:MAG: hypothetical protein BMS9Abin36_0079 [Gammaproteobacteria bacterium]
MAYKPYSRGKRRKKTVRRRPASRGSRSLPNWALLLIGLAVGALLALLIQFLVQRASAPNSGLRVLIDKSIAPVPEASPNSTPAQHKPATRFDFYNILPKTETVLPEPEPTKPARIKGHHYLLQAGSFARYQDADQLKAKLALNGLVASVQKITIPGKGDFHRVRLGPYQQLDELDRTNRQLKAMGIQALRLRVKK